MQVYLTAWKGTINRLKGSARDNDIAHRGPLRNKYSLDVVVGRESQMVCHLRQKLVDKVIEHHDKLSIMYNGR